MDFGRVMSRGRKRKPGRAPSSRRASRISVSLPAPEGPLTQTKVPPVTGGVTFCLPSSMCPQRKDVLLRRMRRNRTRGQPNPGLCYHFIHFFWLISITGECCPAGCPGSPPLCPQTANSRRLPLAICATQEMAEGETMLTWFREAAPIRTKLRVVFGLQLALGAIYLPVLLCLANGRLSVVEAGAIWAGVMAFMALSGVVLGRAIWMPYVATVVRMEALAAGELE